MKIKTIAIAKEGPKKGISQSTMLIILIVVLAIVATIVNPKFLRITNIINIFQQISVLGIVACGVGMLLVSGYIDISVGPQISLIRIGLQGARPPHKRRRLIHALWKIRDAGQGQGA